MLKKSKKKILKNDECYELFSIFNNILKFGDNQLIYYLINIDLVFYIEYWIDIESPEYLLLMILDILSNLLHFG